MSKAKRQIHFPDGTWTYRIGTQHVVIFDPSGSKTLTTCSAMTGSLVYDPRDDGGIRPGHVKSYIARELR